MNILTRAEKKMDELVLLYFKYFIIKLAASPLASRGFAPRGDFKKRKEN